jgi:hypothetical protein
MAPRIKGAMTPANLLQIPIILMRFAALSIGPRMVTKGFTAVCKTDRPMPIINSPERNKK